MYREYLYHKLLKSEYSERNCWVGYQLLTTLILRLKIEDSMRLCIPSVYLSPVIQCESATHEFCWTVK